MKPRTTTLDATIFGVDVQQGDVRGSAPSYALVRLEDEVVDRSVVTARKLHRLIESEQPDVIATDNVYKLASDKDDLIRFLGSLPAATQLVQVTGGPRPEPLSRVANRHDVTYGKDPMDEAFAAAQLAARNVGQVVTAFTDTTQVKVSRGRSTGKGGWSEDRFTRRIHGAVKSEARSVAATLAEADLEYTQEITEKYGGYANAIFTVEAPPNEIPISSRRSGDIRIEIERERRDGIEFQPLTERREYVIVGIDPGTTTGVAIVDIAGDVLDVRSSRIDDTAAVIEWIIAHGIPFIVAADVTPMPNTVEKIRRSFDATAWTPNSDLPVDRKLHRTRDIPYDNDHERDALAAALFAVDDHQFQFERISERVPPHFDRGKVIARVVANGESIQGVLDDLDESTPAEPESEPTPPAEPSPEQRRITTLENRIDRLESHIETLESSLAEKESTIEELETALEAQRREERRDVRERRTVSRLKRDRDRLENERDNWKETAEQRSQKLEKLKRLWKLDHSHFSDIEGEKRGLVPIKPIEQFTVASIESAHDSFGLAPDDVLYLRDASGAGRTSAEYLVDFEPRAIIKSGGLSETAEDILFAAEIPFGDRSAVPLQEVDDLIVTREEAVEALIRGWESRAAARERQAKAQLVDQVISEHRAERPLDHD